MLRKLKLIVNFAVNLVDINWDHFVILRTLRPYFIEPTNASYDNDDDLSAGDAAVPAIANKAEGRPEEGEEEADGEDDVKNVQRGVEEVHRPPMRRLSMVLVLLGPRDVP